jgi:hypothetical protein
MVQFSTNTVKVLRVIYMYPRHDTSLPGHGKYSHDMVNEYMDMLQVPNYMITHLDMVNVPQDIVKVYVYIVNVYLDMIHMAW